MLNLFRNKAAYMGTAVMALLCLVVVAISVRVSLTIIQRKSQIVTVKPQESKKEFKHIKLVNVGKLKEQSFIFNGMEEEAKAFAENRENVFVPFDTILDKLGVDYRYFEPDDALECRFNQQKMVVWMGQGSFRYGERTITLNTAPVAAKGHILVPLELLSGIDGFSMDYQEEAGRVFVNYYGDYKKGLDGYKLLKQVESQAFVTDITGRQLKWSNMTTDVNLPESYEMSPTGSRCIIRTGEGVYMLKGGSGSISFLADIPPGASWSADGKYLYWIDRDKETSFLYDISADAVKELGDYYFRLKAEADNEYLVYGADRLLDYGEYGDVKRVALTNKAYEGNYTFVESEKGLLFKGSVSYSPDRSRMLYHIKGNGYYVANADGSENYFLGDCIEAEWVNNSEIFIRSYEGDTYTVSDNGRDRAEVSDLQRQVGRTEKGDVFYTGRGFLWCESQGVKKQLLPLNFPCDFVYAVSAEGPYLIVSNEMDQVFIGLEDGTVYKLLGYNSLLAGIDFKNRAFADCKTLGISPDRRYAVLLVKKEDLVSLVSVDVVGLKGIQEKDRAGAVKEIVLNLSPQEALDGRLKTLWISGRRLMVFTDRKGWIVELGENPRLFSWSEGEGTQIAGILP